MGARPVNLTRLYSYDGYEVGLETTSSRFNYGVSRRVLPYENLIVGKIALPTAITNYYNNLTGRHGVSTRTANKSPENRCCNRFG